MKLDGHLVPSVLVKSGVRQGCPLSPLLFVLCADVLLREMAQILWNDGEIVQAFADDTAAVAKNYVTALPALAKLFSDYELVSALKLNIGKTVFIPLWRYSSEGAVRSLIREICPVWRDITISSFGKYLGSLLAQAASFVLGKSHCKNILIAPKLGPL
jgi:hypothetical protein